MTKHEDIGNTRWVIADGYIPADDETDRRFISHEAACILNANARDARIHITFYFSDREPLGPYLVVVPARRTLHLRLNEVSGATVPRETDYSTVFESDTPVVIQHTRLDSRRSQLALLSTIAYAG